MKNQNSFKKLSITLLLLSMLALPAMAMAASLSTDQEDYAPWEIVTINGSGFDPASDITLTMEWPDGYVDKFYGTADDSGSFTLTYGKEKMEGTFTVEATDGINTATTTFTDANPNANVTVTANPVGAIGGTFTIDRVLPNGNSQTGGGTTTVTFACQPNSSFKVYVIQTPVNGFNYIGSAEITGTTGAANTTTTVTLIYEAPEIPDNEPPETLITSGPPLWISTNTATFTWTGLDNKTLTENLVYSYKLDAGAWSGYSSATTVTLTGLSDGSHTFQVKAKDEVGIEDPTPASQPFGVDTTGPVIVPTITPLPNDAGWNNTNVTVTWSVTDPESGIVSSSGAGPTTLTSETTYEGTTLTCLATNGAGLSNSVSVTIKIDRTPPNPPTANVSPAPNLAGWNNSIPVTVTFTDNGDAGTVQSGVAGCTGVTTLTDETIGTVVSGTCTDVAGNISVVASVTVKIDKTPPTFGDCPAGGPFLLNSGLQSVGPIEVDASISGLNAAASTLTGSVDTSSVGTKNVTFTAVDNAGNTATKDCTYSVIYKWGGFLPPVTLDGRSLFKLGSTIPVKFQLFDAADNPVSNAVATIRVVQVSGGEPVGTEVDGVSTSAATTGNLFRYDSTGQLYIFNLATKPLSVGSWRINVYLDDGTSQYVDIGIKK